MLSNQLINDFANALIVKTEKPTEYIYYGTMAENGVVLDGASSFTPCTPLVDTLLGDRVMVTIKDHSVYISGVIDRVELKDTDALEE